MITNKRQENRREWLLLVLLTLRRFSLLMRGEIRCVKCKNKHKVVEYSCRHPQKQSVSMLKTVSRRVSGVSWAALGDTGVRGWSGELVHSRRDLSSDCFQRDQTTNESYKLREGKEPVFALQSLYSKCADMRTAEVDLESAANCANRHHSMTPPRKEKANYTWLFFG